MLQSCKSRASAAGPEEANIEHQQMGMAQPQALLFPSDDLPSVNCLNHPDPHTAWQIEPPSCLPSSLETAATQAVRERSLEELEDLLRRVREEQRRLGCFDSSSSLPQRAQTTECESESRLSIALDDSPTTLPAAEGPDRVANTTDRPGNALDAYTFDSPGKQALHKPTTDESMAFASRNILPKSYYGGVNPAILRGFGGDDESIWLVDDEETDSEGIVTPLSSSTSDPWASAAQRRPSVHLRRERDEGIPPREIELLNQQYSPHIFRYRQIPELLDGHEWETDTQAVENGSPPAYDSLALPLPLETPLPGYSRPGESCQGNDVSTASDESTPPKYTSPVGRTGSSADLRGPCAPRQGTRAATNDPVSSTSNRELSEEDTGDAESRAASDTDQGTVPRPRSRTRLDALEASFGKRYGSGVEESAPAYEQRQESDFAGFISRN
ncbi:hypothetical protein NLU13_3362 [Sarocladium strictum]|uniref:Uncharacterized protein n=1 Tax=Sarocladium strictum TaxID=5046 RepID=A0AA39GMP3_SARSR|nr:hypothetical protein NLU13_3362 [Sarocladium strictum]